MKIRRRVSAGFTLTEIMIVVAIIGLLATLVAPHAMRARERACLDAIRNNLRVLEDSKAIWATERRARVGAVPLPTDLEAYLKGDRLPVPVAGETYNINPIGSMASATLAQSLVGLPVGTDYTLE